MPDPAEIFAANLRRLRQERGLTQEQLALEAGMDMADVGRIEKQGREPKVRTIAKLAVALEIDPGELFRPQNDESPGRKGPGLRRTGRDVDATGRGRSSR